MTAQACFLLAFLLFAGVLHLAGLLEVLLAWRSWAQESTLPLLSAGLHLSAALLKGRCAAPTCPSTHTALSLQWVCRIMLQSAS